jgi:ADP-heptose:LPS heptosyltransferase
MLGPAEMERFDEDSRRLLARIAPVLYEEDVCDAAEHVASAAAFIGNDAGMTHLAAFLGIPTIAIFTATDPATWRPIGDKVSIIDARDTDRPSLDLVFSTLHKLIGAG